jgi:hypothetical protein
MKRLLLVLSLLPGPILANTLYKCTDESGAVLFTNQKVPKKNCIVLSHTPMPAPATTSGTAVAAKSRAASAPTPGDFPKVTGSEQKARDSDRKAILDKELANEMQSADKARKALQEGAGNLPADRQQQLRDTLALHERNVESLKKELGNLR